MSSLSAAAHQVVIVGAGAGAGGLGSGDRTGRSRPDSQEAASVTGANIAVNGGPHMQ